MALHCTVLHITSLHTTTYDCTAQYYIALHCTVLHSNVLHSTALHSTALHNNIPHRYKLVVGPLKGTTNRNMAKTYFMGGRHLIGCTGGVGELDWCFCVLRFFDYPRRSVDMVKWS